jgi:hypothetical protein
MRPQSLALVRPRALALGVTWRFVLAAWAGSRLLFMVAGAVGHDRVFTALHLGVAEAPPGTFSYWAHWDGAWFSGIAEDGYGSAPSTAFFPLYPLLIRAVGLFGAGPALAGVVISLGASLAAFYFLYEVAEAELGTRVARASTLVLAFFPTAFFLNAVYSESLFLACATGCVWALRVRRSLLLAGVFGYLAAATRNVGILLVIPMLFEWWRRRRDVGLAGLVPVALTSLSLGAYMFFLWQVSKKPLLFALVQRTNWGRRFQDPATTVRDGAVKAWAGIGDFVHPGRVLDAWGYNESFAAANTFNFVVLVGLLVLLVVCVRLLPPGLSLYAVAVTLVPIANPPPDMPLMSLPRLVLAGFPLFLVLGWMVARSRVALGVWLTASAALGVYLTVLFVSWRWVA